MKDKKILIKFVIRGCIIFCVLCMIALILFVKSKIPNDKYHATMYSSTDEIMENFEKNKSNYEEFIS